MTAFQEEEELKLILEGWRRQHDCEEAGCSMNPAGEKIPEGKPQKRRRTQLNRAREIWIKHRKGSLT